MHAVLPGSPEPGGASCRPGGGAQAVPPEHPVRHGLARPAFVTMIGLMWVDLLVDLQAHAGRSRDAGS